MHGIFLKKFTYLMTPFSMEITNSYSDFDLDLICPFNLMKLC
ncbi:hypothetical protein HanPI659440_Chr11g0425331 [Helianthus annuus]|nr:hypothetical protein HanPI659440_Chr11g0425331 [Helianthus annuus]